MDSKQKRQIEEDLLYKSLIGKNIEILESKNKKQVGMKGKIIFETANFLEILQNGQNKRILKQNITFKLNHKGKALKMDGRLLTNTIRFRIKKIR